MADFNRDEKMKSPPKTDEELRQHALDQEAMERFYARQKERDMRYDIAKRSVHVPKSRWKSNMIWLGVCFIVLCVYLFWTTWFAK